MCIGEIENRRRGKGSRCEESSGGGVALTVLTMVARELPQEASVVVSLPPSLSLYLVKGRRTRCDDGPL